MCKEIVLSCLIAMNDTSVCQTMQVVKTSSGGINFDTLPPSPTIRSAFLVLSEIFKVPRG